MPLFQNVDKRWPWATSVEVISSSRDAIAHGFATLLTEVNSVPDNERFDENLITAVISYLYILFEKENIDTNNALEGSNPKTWTYIRKTIAPVINDGKRELENALKKRVLKSKEKNIEAFMSALNTVNNLKEAAACLSAHYSDNNVSFIRRVLEQVPGLKKIWAEREYGAHLVNIIDNLLLIDDSYQKMSDPEFKGELNKIFNIFFGEDVPDHERRATLLNLAEEYKRADPREGNNLSGLSTQIRRLTDNIDALEERMSGWFREEISKILELPASDSPYRRQED